MNESITLNKIKKNSNTVVYDFYVSEGLKKYFTGKNFLIEYPENMESVPDGVLAVPFVCNILPLIWITNSTLNLKELDNAFYNSIPEFKSGYIKMYPEIQFLGQVNVKNIVNCDFKTSEKKSAMFYSGGLDSCCTLVKHFEENPVLVSIWGSDIRYDNVEGWERTYSTVEEAAELFKLDKCVIKSTFREFDDEYALDRDFQDMIGDGWWHGFKHGIGLIGHIAPFAYLKKINTIYIAASFFKDWYTVKSASSPLIDNFIKFTSCDVIHDGFDLSRQDKARIISNYFCEKPTKLRLHICWKDVSGNNCCKCEKCYRTMMNFWTECVDIKDYGFFPSYENLRIMESVVFNTLMKSEAEGSLWVKLMWVDIQKNFISNKEKLKADPYYKYFRWILKADFQNPTQWKDKDSVKLRQKLSQFGLYKQLYRIKKNLLSKNI